MVRSSKKLIELVRANPCLYDKRHPRYLNVSHKRDLWALISKEMDMPTLKCKTRWNNMRDSYRKATLKKSKTYKYSKHLAFLNPFLKQEISVEHEFKETLSTSDGDWDDDSSAAGREPAVELSEAEAGTPYYLPDFKDAPDAEAHVTPYVCPEHPVDAFLSGVAPVLKCLGGVDQSLAKMEIYQVVHKYELKSLRDQEEAERAAAAGNGPDGLKVEN